MPFGVQIDIPLSALYRKAVCRCFEFKILKAGRGFKICGTAELVAEAPVFECTVNVKEVKACGGLGGF